MIDDSRCRMQRRLTLNATLYRMLPQFLSLLDHGDVEVRSAAGENIALLYESAQRSGVTLPYDAEIIERFRVMSKDSSKKNSKKDRKVQRTVFRDIHATLAVRIGAEDAAASPQRQPVLVISLSVVCDVEWRIAAGFLFRQE